MWKESQHYKFNFIFRIEKHFISSLLIFFKLLCVFLHSNNMISHYHGNMRCRYKGFHSICILTSVDYYVVQYDESLKIMHS